jgi:NDP-sugar pyrophosphorylase family protein
VAKPRLETERSTIAGIVLAGSYRIGAEPAVRFLRDPLLPIAQLPAVSYPLRWLIDSDLVSEAVICAHEATPAVKGAFGERVGRVGKLLRYFVEDHPRGPAGCVRDAAFLTNANTFIVVEGSLLPTLQLDKLIASHMCSGAVATLVVEHERRHAGASLPARPGGIYVFDRSVLDLVAVRGYQDIKEGLLERLYRADLPVNVFGLKGVTPRVSDFTSFIATSRWLTTNVAAAAKYYPEFVPLGEGLCHPTAQISATARFIGPVLIGQGAVIGENAVVVGPASLGPFSVVGADALVTCSFVMGGATVGAEARLEECVVAPGADVESGATMIRQTVLAAPLPQSRPRRERPSLAPSLGHVEVRSRDPLRNAKG